MSEKLTGRTTPLIGSGGLGSSRKRRRLKPSTTHDHDVFQSFRVLIHILSLFPRVSPFTCDVSNNENVRRTYLLRCFSASFGCSLKDLDFVRVLSCLDSSLPRLRAQIPPVNASTQEEVGGCFMAVLQAFATQAVPQLVAAVQNCMVSRQNTLKSLIIRLTEVATCQLSKFFGIERLR